MHFRIHVPNSCEVDDNFIKKNSFNFFALEELLNHSFMKNISKESDFFRFSLAPFKAHGIFGAHLMAEFDSGYKWVVLGLITDGALHLPLWEYKRKEEI